MNSYIKVGLIVILLLILVVGPLLQIYDCFNDSPNLDHDALLHTIDALLSIALILAFNAALAWILAIFWLDSDFLRRMQGRACLDFLARPIPSISPHALSLRI